MSLKEQMLKAGLISEKEAKRTAHQERVQNKRDGRQERERRAQKSREEAQRQMESQKDRDRRLEEERQARQAEREKRLQAEAHQRSVITAAYREGALSHWEGNRRYFFANGERVDLILVTDEVARKLEAGQAAVVAGREGHPFPLVIHSGAARKLREAAPEKILVFHAPTEAS